MSAATRFRKEKWCMDLGYLGKLAKKNNGVKYLFDRTVNAKGMKTKDPQEFW